MAAPISSQPSLSCRAEWLAESHRYLADGAAAHAFLKKINGVGEHLLAIEIAEQLVATGTFPDKVPVLQQFARALAILGSSEEARKILEKIPAKRADEAETLGLLARVWKDLATAATAPAEIQKCFAASLDCYSSGFGSAVEKGDSAGATYCGINAAAVAIWLGDHAIAADFAEKAFAYAASDPGYYALASRAEAALILGREDEAKQLYSQASALGESEKRWADIASTCKQCRALSQKIYGKRDRFDSCFTSGAVAVLSGQVAPPDSYFSGTFCHQRIRDWLEKNEIAHAFVGVLPGWDLILADLCQEKSIETHLVVPPGIAATLSGKWREIYERVLARATSVTVLNSGIAVEAKGMANFSGLMVAARGALLSQHLGVALKALALGEKPESSAASAWRSLNLETFAIFPAQPEKDGIPEKDAPPDPVPFPRTMAPTIEREPVVALLLLHFHQYAEMDARGFADFQEEILRPLAEILAASTHPPLSQQGFGADYLFVFDRLHPAAITALSFLEKLNHSAPISGKAPVSLSICLHAGPVAMHVNPLLHIYEPTGDTVARAALIATELSPGTIFATETFAAISALESLRGFRFEHSGNTEINGRADRLFRLHPAH